MKPSLFPSTKAATIATTQAPIRIHSVSVTETSLQFVRRASLAFGGKLLAKMIISSRLYAAPGCQPGTPAVGGVRRASQYSQPSNCATLRDSASKHRAGLQRQIAKVQADIAVAVDALPEKPSKALRERLDALEECKDRLDAELAELEPESCVDFHPKAVEGYRRKTRDLRAVLAAVEEGHRREAYRIIRELVEKIVIRPTGSYKPIDLEIHGSLATLPEAPKKGAIEETRSIGGVCCGGTI
jgi:hypothetical protein